MVLSVFYYVLDLRLWRVWAFGLVVCGVNAIVAYVAPILFKTFILQGWHWNYYGSTMSLQDAYVKALSGQFGAIWGSWAYTFSYMLFWWVILFWLYRRKVFLRV
jgi:predicted acyltransferase